MQNEIDVLSQFITKKEADSDFIKLNDGESVTVKELVKVESVTTTDFNGKPADTLRFTVLVDTVYGEKTKTFDNKSLKFAAEVRAKGVRIGSGFRLTRHGLSQKTVYFISDVKNPAAPAAAPAQQFVVPAAPADGGFTPPAA